MTEAESPDAVAADERTEARPRRPARVDPEDWAATPADDEERYQQERPPHWQ